MRILTITYWSGSFNACELIKKNEIIQKRYLRIVLDDYESVYDILLRKRGNVTMEMNQLRVLVIEIFKAVNKLI